MIKIFRNSLNKKVFLLTSIILIVSCMVTYGLIALFMPRSYSVEITKDLENSIGELILILQDISYEEGVEYIQEFCIVNNAIVETYDAAGNFVPALSSPQSSEIDVDVKADLQTDEVKIQDYYVIISMQEMAEGIAMQGYTTTIDQYEQTTAIAAEFSFYDSKEVYTIHVQSDIYAINYAVNALSRILPYLFLFIIVLSLSVSWFYSRYITRPIVQISRISKQMAQLEFDWHCDDRRMDEIGVLASSLNELSAQLQTSLTELKAANASLQQDIDFAREQEKKRLAFFAAVSHELKTPITIIKGQLEGMLKNIGVYKDREKYLNRSLTVTGSMEEMVKEILTISQMESDDFQLQLETVDFTAMVQDRLRFYTEIAAEKEIHISLCAEEGLMVHGDQKLLEKAVSNLILNGIQYSPTGEQVIITAKKIGEDLQFIVENTGVHIAEEEMEHLYQAFYRLEKSRNRSTGGSGLGLYIVKMVLDFHQANYWMENTVAGVKFTFIL